MYRVRRLLLCLVNQATSAAEVKSGATTSAARSTAPIPQAALILIGLLLAMALLT